MKPMQNAVVGKGLSSLQKQFDKIFYGCWKKNVSYLEPTQQKQRPVLK